MHRNMWLERNWKLTDSQARVVRVWENYFLRLFSSFPASLPLIEQSHTRQGKEAIERAVDGWVDGMGKKGILLCMGVSLLFCSIVVIGWEMIESSSSSCWCVVCVRSTLSPASGEQTWIQPKTWIEEKNREKENHQTCNRRILFRLNSIKEIISSFLLYFFDFFFFSSPPLSGPTLVPRWNCNQYQFVPNSTFFSSFFPPIQDC